MSVVGTEGGEPWSVPGVEGESLSDSGGPRPYRWDRVGGGRLESGSGWSPGDVYIRKERSSDVRREGGDGTGRDQSRSGEPFRQGRDRR